MVTGDRERKRKEEKGKETQILIRLVERNILFLLGSFKHK
jgi:hypothetical protein